MRFRLDQRAVETIERWPSMVDCMADTADEVASAAKEATPVRTAHLRRSITAGNGRVDGRGAVATVGSTDAGAVAAEVGSVNNPPYGMFQRGVRAAGLRLERRGR